ncbi:Leucine-rich repeat [Ostreococcus tauri]|uniref:Leucine-rich repeat n=1 Tax=Ostreococcus tauri TaxID=70448 RepID=A0A090LYL0_OSTTA|nr:Leucine-rich repeat [Ostreococcus tauri]CEF97110.1 Leucine-rich repeat [Ostreococcus tauri]|eukprot:XP_022838491.1 Leucine-rich repeat [Ostreococcus tauri]
MARITLEMLRRRAEHNDGSLLSLEEVALHRQGLERLEGLQEACPRLKIALLQDNLISRIENMRKLKDLEYLNLAMNNVTCVENLEQCESLTKLDLTMNFIALSGLMSVKRLEVNHNLRQLYLMGNPCADFDGYRSFVIGSLPQLANLDGSDVTHVERIVARRELRRITQELETAARTKIETIATVDEIASIEPDHRPWCAATRVLDNENIESTLADTVRSTSSSKTYVKESFEPLPDDIADVKQKNQGDFKFRLIESDDDTAIELELHVGKFIDTSLILVDIQPMIVRVKIKGELLQLKLPHEVSTDSSTAERSKVTGKLLIKMPKLNWHVKPKTAIVKVQSRAEDQSAKVTYHGMGSDEPPDV